MNRPPYINVGAAALFLACSSGEVPPAKPGGAPSDIVADDGSGGVVRLAAPATRIVSVTPSATEILLSLGVGDRIVGRTDYDLQPELSDRPSIGGGIDPSHEVLTGLRPDLIVAWSSDTTPALKRRFAGTSVTVVSHNTRDTSALFAGVARLGRLTGRDSAASSLVTRLRLELGDVARATAARGRRPSVFYVVWPRPAMTAGPKTFVSELIAVAGGRTAFPELRQDWPQVSFEAIARRDPDVVLITRGTSDSAGTRATALRALPGWRSVGAVKAGRIIEMEDNLLNRPGPNTGAAARRLAELLEPYARP